MTAIDDELEQVPPYAAEMPPLTDADSPDGGAPRDEGEDYYRSWDDVDLGPALRGERTSPVPSVFRRQDGRHLLYPGQVNGMHGDSGAGKSLAASACVAQELRADQHVIWLDFEDPDETTIVGRLQALGLTAGLISERFHYKHPEVAADQWAIGRLVDECSILEPRLIVVDSVGEAFSLEGIDENKDVEVAPWFRRALRPLTETGAAIFPIDHGTKAADNPLYPSGSKRKRAAITGAAYLAEVAVPFSREHAGSIRLTCAKDRHGHWARGEVVALIHVEPYPDGGIGLSIDQPPAAATNEGNAGEQIYAAASAAVDAIRDAGDPLTLRELQARMEIRARADIKRAGIDAAARVGAITVTAGARRAHLHTWTRDLTDTDRTRIAGDHDSDN